MVPNVVPSISMAVILVPILGRSSNALTPAQQTNSPRISAGSDYQTGSMPFPPLTQIILKRRARRREGGPPERERPELSFASSSDYVAQYQCWFRLPDRLHAFSSFDPNYT